jgi:hypothetical protein
MMTATFEEVDERTGLLLSRIGDAHHVEMERREQREIRFDQIGVVILRGQPGLSEPRGSRPAV